MIRNTDSRAKFLIVLFITGIGVATENIAMLFVTFLSAVFFAKLFDVKVLKIAKRLKRVLYLLLFIIVIQSIFTNEGTPIIEVLRIKVITDVGLKRGLGYLFRVMIILMSGAIISSSSTSDILKGFSKLKMPYELAFTASLGIRFLPILMEEINNTYTAINLRGIDIKELKIKERIQMIAYLFMPVLYSTILRSKKLSESVETRGFAVGGKRTNYRDIKFKRSDYILCVFTVIFFACVIYFFTLKGDLSENLIFSLLFV